MAWESVHSSTVGLAEDAKTNWISLDPKELAHVQVARTDGGTTDPVIIKVYGSVDALIEDTIPLWAFTTAAALNSVASFFVQGPRYFRVELTTGGSTDDVVVDVHVLRDGGIVV